MIHKAQTIQLTEKTVDSLSAKQVLYAEISESGAMGNAGGIMFYILENEQLICYETNAFSDQKTFSKVNLWLLKHQNELASDEVEVAEVLFNYHYGGVGNHILINKNINLHKADNRFIYSKSDQQYEIACSVLGVFNAVAYSIENPQNK